MRLIREDALVQSSGVQLLMFLCKLKPGSSLLFIDEGLFSPQTVAVAPNVCYLTLF